LQAIVVKMKAAAHIRYFAPMSAQNKKIINSPHQPYYSPEQY